MNRRRDRIDADDEEVNVPERTGRPKRIPLGTRNVLTAPKRKGYVRRWVNDTPDRIDAFIAAGYEVVRDNIPTGDPKAGEDSPVGTAVSKSVGLGTKAVLMEIPQDWYDEDQEKRQSELKVQEDSMRRNVGKTPVDDTGQYGTVDIKQGQ